MNLNQIVPLFSIDCLLSEHVYKIRHSSSQIKLRQVDVLLLCQLWCLNEQIDEQSRAIRERVMKPNCLAAATMDLNASTTENVYESVPYDDDDGLIYENADATDRLYENTWTSAPSSSRVPGNRGTDDSQESVYLEPIPDCLERESVSDSTTRGGSHVRSKCCRHKVSQVPRYRLIEPMSSEIPVWTTSFLLRQASEANCD